MRVQTLCGRLRAELRQRRRLDLPHALSREREPPSDLLEGETVASTDAEAQAEHFLLPLRQRSQQTAEPVADLTRGDPFHDGFTVGVGDDVAQAHVAVRVEWGVHADRL